MKKFYITTAIVYANAFPHAGHAYEIVTTDIMARYKKMRGFDVYFSTGSDEHSINVFTKALEQGKDPKVYCDEMAKIYKDLWKKYDIAYDDFIQTTEERHKKTVADIFKRCFDSGDIYKGTYEGWYCRSCEAFYNETELVDGCCPTHKMKPDIVKEENYFLKLTKYSEKLLKHIQDNPSFIEPASRRNNAIAMINEGLRDISVSRNGQKWGIPLSFDPEHKVYVWFDALINYVSAAGYADNAEKFKKYWPCDMHVIGKDIVKFHCIIWPIMLMSAGIELPKKVYGHGFLLNKGEKMSKTRGNVVDPEKTVDTFGCDAVRHYFAARVVNGDDGEFNEESVKTAFNVDLANDLGNLINRSLNMVEKYCAAAVPAYKKEIETPRMKEIREAIEALEKEYTEKMDSFDLSLAMEKVWKRISIANKFIDEAAPWKLAKEGKTAEVDNVMFLLLEIIRLTSICVSPVMPSTAVKIWKKLGVNYAEGYDFEKEMKFGVYPQGTKVEKGDPLFPRIEEKKS